MPHMTETRNIGEPQTLPITDLNLHHKNARIGDVEAIKGSMVANGVYKPIVVNKGTYTGRPNEVLAGNHSLKAMRELAEENPTDPRWQNVAVWLIDVDEERATRVLLSDNATADKGTYDNAQLLELLEAVDHDLDGTGYDYDELDELKELVDLEGGQNLMRRTPNRKPHPPTQYRSSGTYGTSASTASLWATQPTSRQ